MDARSASRELDVIQSSFPGNNATELKGLFKIGDNGVDFSAINEKDFGHAIKGLSDDEQALAYGYYSLINSTTRNTVEVVTPTERYSRQAATTIFHIPNTWTRDILPTATGKDVDYVGGGGLNWSVFGQNHDLIGRFSIFVINSGQTTGDYQTSAIAGSALHLISSGGETSAHEVIGHGLGRLSSSPTWSHEDAIQLSNLYRRINVSVPSNIDWRNGTDHSSNIAIPYDKANGIPDYIRQGLFNFKLGQALLGN